MKGVYQIHFLAHMQYTYILKYLYLIPNLKLWRISREIQTSETFLEVDNAVVVLRNTRQMCRPTGFSLYLEGYRFFMPVLTHTLVTADIMGRVSLLYLT